MRRCSPLGTTAVFAVSLLAFAGCGTTLRRPASGPMDPGELVEVPYPPPVARVETIPVPPDATSVWIDGAWDWIGDRWSWAPGSWTKPMRGAHFVAWKTSRDRSGRLLFAKSGWRDDAGKLIGNGDAGTCPVGGAAP